MITWPIFLGITVKFLNSKNFGSLVIMREDMKKFKDEEDLVYSFELEFKFKLNLYPSRSIKKVA